MALGSAQKAACFARRLRILQPFSRFDYFLQCWKRFDCVLRRGRRFVLLVVFPLRLARCVLILAKVQSRGRPWPVLVCVFAVCVCVSVATVSIRPRRQAAHRRNAAYAAGKHQTPAPGKHQKTPFPPASRERIITYYQQSAHFESSAFAFCALRFACAAFACIACWLRFAVRLEPRL